MEQRFNVHPLQILVFVLMTSPLIAVAQDISWFCASDTAPWPTRGCFPSTVFEDKIWIFNGANFGTARHDIWSSGDGMNWTCEVGSVPYSMAESSTALVFNDALWILGGEEGC